MTEKPHLDQGPWLLEIVASRGISGLLEEIAADGSRVPELRRVEVPTLVVHGADDPLVNHRAGRSIADAVPGAHFRLVRGMGHDLPPGVCDLLADEVNGLIKRLA